MTTNHTTKKFILASSNRHKYAEIAAGLGDRCELVLQSEAGIQSVPETGRTFVENALLKARHACRESGLPAIADDSGLCVSALGQAPGVWSARFAGEGATDAANNDKLMWQLEKITHRKATFHCVLLLLYAPDDAAPIIAEGIWHGEIAMQARGANGFGYDPLFLIPQLGKTAAELTPDEKNTWSHRGVALRGLREKMNV